MGTEMHNQIKLYLATLGLDKTATKDDIKNAYRRLALQFHPDKSRFDSHDTFAKIKEAYEFLIKWDGPLDEFTDDKWSELFYSLLNDLTDTLLAKIKKKNRKHDEGNIHIKLPVTLDELYKSCIKKLVVRTKADSKGTKLHEDLYISLFQYKKKYIFPLKGDWHEGTKTRGDIIVEIDVVEHPLVKIDNIVCKYDLFIEYDMSLYDYYCRKYLALPFLNNEIIEVDNIYPGQTCACIYDRGLPYHDDVTDEDVRGKVYIHFKLVLPTFEVIPTDVKEMLLKYFVN